MSVSERFVRDLTYPAHEWLRGRRTLRELVELRRLAAATPSVMRADAAERLRNLLTFAGARLPYYAELFARYGVDPRGADPCAELRRLPVQDKADVRAHADHMVWRDVPGGLVPHSSGGTTGDTLHFCIDRVRQAQGLGARLFMQSLFGVQPGQRRLYLWGSPIEARVPRVKRWRDRLLNEMLLDAFDMSPAQMDAHLARILRFRPRVIYGYPTATALLAHHAAARLGPADFPWLRLVVLTGEEVTADQIAQARATFGCAVAMEYGNREVGLIAHDCPRGRLHVVWPHVHVDIAVAGQVAGPGQCGDVICTTLNTRAQPFIRYRVGDVGRLAPEPCPCGMPFPVMRLEGGKITGFIALPNGRLCHGAITSHILRDEPGIVAFKTHQHALDEFEVLLVVDGGFNAETVERVRQRYRELFGPQINVDCRLVDEIPPDPSGKRRYVVSDVAPNYADFEVVSTPRPAAPVSR
jgi:phenylacetate-CoA ligase